MKKLLVTRKNSSQIKPLIREMTKDPFFKMGENLIIYEGGQMSKDDLKKFDVILCDNNPKFITGEKSFNKAFKEQIMIQVTHGVWVKKPNIYLYDNKNIDYILSPNKWSDNLYEKMGYTKKQILSYGYPRIDYYKNLNIKKNLDIIKENINNFNFINKKFLFSPSWLKGNRGEKYKYNINGILKEIPIDSILIISEHGLNKTNEVKIEYCFDKKYKKNVHIWNDNRIRSDELMLFCDELYTDFSSIIFDFAALKGSENVHFFNPLNKPKLQNKKIIDVLKKQYSSWGKGIVSIENGINWNNMDFYNKNKKNVATKKMVEKIKELLY